MPEFNKDSYTPEEVNEIIKSELGEDVARQFRMYYNKVQKVPSHSVSIKTVNTGRFEFQFSMEEFADKLDVPEELLEFTMVQSSRHGGGSLYNMGWLWLDFFDVTSPEGNVVTISYLEEIQSDFVQRIGRLRQVINGSMTEGDLLSFEQDAWNKIKANSQLIETFTVPGVEFTTDLVAQAQAQIRKVGVPGLGYAIPDLKIISLVKGKTDSLEIKYVIFDNDNNRKGVVSFFIDPVTHHYFAPDTSVITERLVSNGDDAARM